MESSESHEPSYYEVALTNRQVLIAFVVLLSCLVSAFLSGVWIGRGGSSTARNPPVTLEASAVPVDPPLEQLTFFAGKEAAARAGGSPAVPPPAVPGSRTAPPAAGAPPTEEERATEAMRQNLDATMAANRTTQGAAAGAPAAAAAAAPTPAAKAPVTSAPAKPAETPAAKGATTKPATKPATTKPATTKPAVAGKTFVQVYSSTNATRAREIVAQLRKAGFAVVVRETPKGGGTNFRVRVGPYADRIKADAAATKLRRDFRLETWVTDSP